MSDLITDILFQNGKNTISSDNKVQDISRQMKGKYDFESLLLQSMLEDNDSSYQNNLDDRGFTHLIERSSDADENNYINDVNAGLNYKHTNKVTNDIKSEYSVNISKIFIEQPIKLVNQMNVVLAKHENAKINNLTSNKNNNVTSVIHDDSVLNEENIRIVKNDKGYTLYLNLEGSDISKSKIVELLKYIENDKRISLNKVVLNREVIFDKNKTNHSDSDDFTESKLNIKV